MYKFCYYLKPKYGKKAKLCHCIHRNRRYLQGHCRDLETRFYTSNYQLKCNSTEGPLPKGKKKKAIALMKGKVSEGIMIGFVGFRAKPYDYLIDDGSEDRKAKGTKRCVTQRTLKFENCKNGLEATQLEKKINYLEKNKN